MHGKLKLAMRISAFAMASVVSSASLAQPATPEAADDGMSGMGEIIVTAQKREQNLQDVPVSITAFSAEALKSNRITSALDLGSLVPNLTIMPSQSGTNTPSITMRGAFTGVNLPGKDRSVAFYLDGVWLSGILGGGLELPDLERVEVLRGPQGTLFGRNSTAGAINIVTRDPRGELGLRVTATLGNYDRHRLAARIDTPQFGPFSASLSYAHNERRGDVRNLGAGMVWDRSGSPITKQGVAVSPRWLGSKNAENLLAAVKFEPSDTFRTVYKFDWMEDNFTPAANGNILFTPASLGATVGGAISNMYAANSFPTLATRRPAAVNNAFTTPAFQTAWGHNLTSYLKIDDSLSLKNILSYRKSHAYANTSYGMDGLLNTSAALGPIGQPYLIFGASTRDRNSQWSEELQAYFKSNFLTLTAGILYLEAKNAYLPTAYSLRVIPGGVFAPVPDTISTSTTKSLGGYAQAEVHITAQLELVGGIRVTRDRKHTVANAPGRSPFISDYSKTKPSYSGGINYKVNDDLLLYGKYAHAFVAGGSINTFDFKEETVNSWEAGFKGEFFDRRLRANIALWDAKYKDLQESTPGRNLGRPDLPSVLVSLGDVHAKGFEAELTAVPVNGLILTGGVGYTDFELTRLNPVFGALSTYKPQQRPAWTGNVSAQYTTGPVIGGSNLLLKVDGNYRGRFPNFQRIPAPAVYEPFRFAEALWLWNARAALQDISIGGGKGELALWVRNLTNEDKVIYPAAASFAADPTAYLYATAAYTPARTFGVEMTFDF